MKKSNIWMILSFLLIFTWGTSSWANNGKLCMLSGLLKSRSKLASSLPKLKGQMKRLVLADKKLKAIHTKQIQQLNQLKKKWTLLRKKIGPINKTVSIESNRSNSVMKRVGGKIKKKITAIKKIHLARLQLRKKHKAVKARFLAKKKKIQQVYLQVEREVRKLKEKVKKIVADTPFLSIEDLETRFSSWEEP